MRSVLASVLHASMHAALALALPLLATACTCPVCPPPAADLSSPADAGAPPDLACQQAGAYCHAPGQTCCAGLVCVGGLCAALPLR